MIILLLFSLQIDHIITETGANIYGAYEHSIPYIVVTFVDTGIDTTYKIFTKNPDIFIIDTSPPKIRFIIPSEKRSILDTMFSIMDAFRYYPAFITIVGDIDENYLNTRGFFHPYSEASGNNYIKKKNAMPLSIEYTDIKDIPTEITIDAPLPHLNSEDYLPLVLGIEWLNHRGLTIGGWKGTIEAKVYPIDGKIELKLKCRPGGEGRVWKRIMRFIGDTTNFSGIDSIKWMVYGKFKGIFTSLTKISDIIILSDTQYADPELFYENIKMYLNAITPKDVKDALSKFFQSKENWKINVRGDMEKIDEQFFIGR